jgi:hypothetical protein
MRWWRRATRRDAIEPQSIEHTGPQRAYNARMRTEIILSALITACGGDTALAPDASTDAPVPDAAMECGPATKLCGAVCAPITEDEKNCGDCGVVCRGGATCTGTCECPAPFVPTTIEPTQFDQFRLQGQATVAISPTFGDTGIHPILIGYATTTALNTDIDLAVSDTPPFAAAGYGLDIQTMLTDAAYRAVSGTLRLTAACATEARGTLTNVKFQGVTGGIAAPVLDPMGCTFTVPAVAFHIMTAPCQ